MENIYNKPERKGLSPVQANFWGGLPGFMSSVYGRANLNINTSTTEMEIDNPSLCNDSRNGGFYFLELAGVSIGAS